MEYQIPEIRQKKTGQNGVTPNKKLLCQECRGQDIANFGNSVLGTEFWRSWRDCVSEANFHLFKMCTIALKQHASLAVISGGFFPIFEFLSISSPFPWVVSHPLTSTVCFNFSMFNFLSILLTYSSTALLNAVK